MWSDVISFKLRLKDISSLVSLERDKSSVSRTVKNEIVSFIVDSVRSLVEWFPEVRLRMAAVLMGCVVSLPRLGSPRGAALSNPSKNEGGELYPQIHQVDHYFPQLFFLNLQFLPFAFFRNC